MRGVSAVDVGSDSVRLGAALEAGRRPGLILDLIGDELAGIEAPRLLGPVPFVALCDEEIAELRAPILDLWVVCC